MLSVLRQPRYVALSALMLVVAVLCVSLGTWQIAREHAKHAANDSLRRNDRAAVVPVAEVLPLLGSARTPGADAVQFRRVTATGVYDGQHQSLVRGRTVADHDGYLVLTPLRTADGTLLVVRGLLAAGPAAQLTAPSVPAGQVAITGRVQPGEDRADRAAVLPAGQVATINPVEQAARLATPVRAGFVEIEAGQPGSEGLVAMNAPDLSNPAGGAVEPQHIAYIVQWYLFAALALAAPLVMAAAESRRADLDTHELDSPDVDLPEHAVPDPVAAARLDDRYGRAPARAVRGGREGGASTLSGPRRS